MTPKQRYLHDIEKNTIKPDSAQAMAVDALEHLYQEYALFLEQEPQKKPTFLERITGKKAESKTPPKGLYMWGGVGRGKTYLMDAFFDTLTPSKNMRIHFHRFMYRVHEELAQLDDTSDPLLIVADRLKAEADIICFDEFYVSDITDAMILGTLFEALFARGVILVATSNIPPSELYRNGLQRARFMPAIKLIEQNCQIINVDSGVDYRLRTLENADIYHSPNDDLAMEHLQEYFAQLVGHPWAKEQSVSIDVNHRQVDVINASNGVLFANFEQLCQTARSQNDYIELSKVYHTVLLSDVKQMDRSLDDAARRFIALVDEFYERKVKLIISAEVELESLYTSGQLEFEFKRCCSRLTEMQSRDYLSEAHLT
ncbi:cell division protein ZapE [Vibrio sp. WJH972]